MKVYKFLLNNKYFYCIADNILDAKKWMNEHHKGAKFITIEKVISWK